MKAIVVRQPYAALIIAGIKTIETRPAPPNGPMRPTGVRGLPGLSIKPGERIAICAAAAKPKDGEMVGDWECVKMTSSRWWAVHFADGVPCAPDGLSSAWVDLHFGAVVGTVVVTEALPVVDEDSDEWESWPMIEVGGAKLSHWWPSCGAPGDEGDGRDITDQLPLGEYAPGRWGWLLTDPQPCAPIPVTGKQGVFALPADVFEAVTA